ncbi:hypothetical protein ACQP0C_17720 [Nocardia sp. CA-129566]|uniref:hypothetical protein n=1 Tax=Nocardia sp. CA-129566 TaxID=3239976 RepID=UPI003D971B71
MTARLMTIYLRHIPVIAAVTGAAQPAPPPGPHPRPPSPGALLAAIGTHILLHHGQPLTSTAGSAILTVVLAAALLTTIGPAVSPTNLGKRSRTSA